MKTVERYLCAECAKTLRDSALTFKKVPGTEGESPKCEWCRKPRYCTAYTIVYGKERG